MTTATYASSYERMTGGCTRHLAHSMLAHLSLPPITPSSYILDNACGPGIVTSVIKSAHPAAKVLVTDLAPAMIAEVTEAVTRNGWSDVDTDVLDVRDLKTLSDDTFTDIFANLALPVPGDADAGKKVCGEMFRVLERGGMAMVTTWADRVWPTAFTATALRIRPSSTPVNAMAMAPECFTGSWLLQQLEAGGFGNNVEISPVVTYTSAASLDELAENMLMAQGMFFPGFDAEELMRAKVVFREEMEGLRTFERVEGGGVRIGMKAWIGVGWKKGDEGRVVS